jgi:hypothetical protein
METAHNYDLNSLEEIIRSAQKTGLSDSEIADRLGIPKVSFLKWLIELNHYNRQSTHNPAAHPMLEVKHDRLDYLADYCRTQGIFPIITSLESGEPIEGRTNPFKQQMTISWKKFLNREFRHPTSDELINQLENDAVAYSGIVVDRKYRTITVNGHKREYGNSGQAFEQSYRRLKKQMLDQ